jgi:hypothetical protein
MNVNCVAAIFLCGLVSINSGAMEKENGAQDKEIAQLLDCCQQTIEMRNKLEWHTNTDLKDTFERQLCQKYTEYKQKLSEKLSSREDFVHIKKGISGYQWPLMEACIVSGSYELAEQLTKIISVHAHDVERMTNCLEYVRVYGLAGYGHDVTLQSVQDSPLYKVTDFLLSKGCEKPLYEKLSRFETATIRLKNHCIKELTNNAQLSNNQQKPSEAALCSYLLLSEVSRQKQGALRFING